MEPDLDWYIDHVVLPSGPELAPVGPIRAGEAEWAAAVRESSTTTDPEVFALATEQGLVLSCAQARTAGLPDAQVRRLLRRGTWTSPRYGVLSIVPRVADPALAGSAAALCRPGTVISHATAGALHCLPLLDVVGPPTLTSDHRHQACSRDDVRLHVATTYRDEIEDWFGAPVTTIERTIVDLARERGVRQGLVAADAALHELVTTPRALRRAVQRQRGWPGVRAARRAVDLADGRAESPLESLSRLCLIDGGLPTPEPQAWVETAVQAYRVDLLYRAQRVIIEADGLLKYRSGEYVLVDEKLRQEHLERAGYIVVQVLWDDVVNHPVETVARVRRALAGR